MLGSSLVIMPSGSAAERFPTKLHGPNEPWFQNIIRKAVKQFKSPLSPPYIKGNHEPKKGTMDINVSFIAENRFRGCEVAACFPCI